MVLERKRTVSEENQCCMYICVEGEFIYTHIHDEQIDLDRGKVVTSLRNRLIQSGSYISSSERSLCGCADGAWRRGSRSSSSPQLMGYMDGGPINVFPRSAYSILSRSRIHSNNYTGLRFGLCLCNSLRRETRPSFAQHSPSRAHIWSSYKTAMIVIIAVFYSDSYTQHTSSYDREEPFFHLVCASRSLHDELRKHTLNSSSSHPVAIRRTHTARALDHTGEHNRSESESTHFTDREHVPF